MARGWRQPERGFLDCLFETIGTIHTVWVSRGEDLTVLGRMMKGVEMAIAFWILLAILLPDVFGTICKEILRGSNGVVGHQMPPLQTTRRRPQASQVPRRPQGPDLLERLIASGVHESKTLVSRALAFADLTTTQRSDYYYSHIVPHLVEARTACLRLASRFITPIIHKGNEVGDMLKRAQGRWSRFWATPTRAAMVLPPKGRVSGEALVHPELVFDPLWTNVEPTSMPVRRWQPEHTVESWEAHKREVEELRPWQLATLKTPMHLRRFYYGPAHQYLRRPRLAPPMRPAPHLPAALPALPAPTNPFPAGAPSQPAPQLALPTLPPGISLEQFLNALFPAPAPHLSSPEVQAAERPAAMANALPTVPPSVLTLVPPAISPVPPPYAQVPEVAGPSAQALITDDLSSAFASPWPSSRPAARARSSRKRQMRREEPGSESTTALERKLDPCLDLDLDPRKRRR
ncbi:hypothetical protein TWF696_002484 [Orbilia brochopaga]|uniref:Uncharacterized protein n=1 Tax=Orbilia brochopaga TaxID=3140254 RepID=A0AAV9U5Q4_9PEZI